MTGRERESSWGAHHWTIVLVLILTVVAALLIKVTGRLTPSGVMHEVSLPTLGFQRIYPIVRAGDDAFQKGELRQARDYYTGAQDALRDLQAEFPERSGSYRDAERVVQTRIYLAEAAEGLSGLRALEFEQELDPRGTRHGQAN